MDNFNVIQGHFERNDFRPVYFLDGDEPYYIDQLVHRFEQDVIPENERDFNLISLYGREVTWKEVINAARRYPMFGDRLLVVLKEAAQMKDLNELTSYLEQPMASTVLVIEHRFKKLDNRSKLKKAIDSVGVYFHSQRLKEADVPQWIVNFCHSRQVKINFREAELLTAYLGNDIQKIANEIQKILISNPSIGEINDAVIEKFIGISREYNAFDLPDALFSGNVVKLAGILNYFNANPKVAPIQLVLGSFYTYLRGVYLAYGNKPNFQSDRKLGIWGTHRKTAQSLPQGKVDELILTLEEFSHKAVGVDSLSRGQDLLMEMTGKMLAIVR